MRLGDILSKPINKEFIQIDGFLMNKKGKIGQKVDIEEGLVCLNYFCKTCEDMRTFYSKGKKLSCIFVNKNLISIDCVLSCICGSTVQVWFLVESEGDITSVAPKVRIIKKSERLSNTVDRSDNDRYGKYTYLLDKADRAYREGLGAGAVIYLRKVYELLAVDSAESAGINRLDKNNKRKKFKTLLKEVDAKWNIIPKQFSENGYKIFEELSNIIHGEFDEELALEKFDSLKRLVTGVTKNVVENLDYAEGINKLGWNGKDGE